MFAEIKPMKMVHKFPFSIKAKKFTLQLPKDFKFLDVAFQGDQANVWVETADPLVREDVHFETFGTGQDIPLTATWMTTFSFGPFVFHLYQIIDKPRQE